MIYKNRKLAIPYYDVEEMPRILKILVEHNGMNWNGRKRKYLDWSITYDIESTNFRDFLKKLALMYIWMLGLEDDQTGFIYCIVGRTWEEWTKAMGHLSDLRQDEKSYIPVYVHNLSFEYFFMRPYIMEKECFVVKSNDILYVRTWDGIEFRCSMKNSGCKLGDITKFLPDDVKIKKLEGDLDYDVIRTPITPMYDEEHDNEMAYCLNDVRVLCKYISQKRKEDGNTAKIPYTKTGYGRRGIREFVFKDMDKKEKMNFIRRVSGTTFHSVPEMIAATKAFMGGHTAGSPLNSGKVIEDVTCYDFSSSYPAVCMSNEFPIELMKSVPEMSEPEFRIELELNHAAIFKVTFKGLRPRHYKQGKLDETIKFDFFIPSSKCEELEGEKKYNGKVSHAETCSIWCTNLDFNCYDLYYEWDEAVFTSVFIYKKGYLPKKVIEYIGGLYRDKTTLKGVNDRKLEYQLKKELLNAVSYGMNVTNPTKDVLLYDSSEDSWKASENGEFLDDIYDFKDPESYHGYWEEKVKAYNKKLLRGEICITYIQGIFISSIARSRNLSLGILAAGLKHLFVYSDTDSIYVQHADEISDFIQKYNNRVKREMEAMCRHYDLPIDWWCPKTIKGVPKPLGYWDFDGHSKYFKQCGAKRYVKIDDNNHFKITIAGLSKRAGAEYIAKMSDPECKIDKDDITVSDPQKVLNFFDIGMEIPEGETGKLAHTIFRSTYEGTLVDYQGMPYKYHIEGGVNLEPTSFVMNHNDDYAKFLKLLDCAEDRNMMG